MTLVEIRERYYFSPERLECKKNSNHDYAECPEEDECPYAFCDTCKIDYVGLDYLGDYFVVYE